jgi:hypothetical protein
VIKLPIEVGDTILTGKFRNHPTVVKDIGVDEWGHPTVNGKPILKVRISNFMNKKHEAESLANIVLVSASSQLGRAIFDVDGTRYTYSLDGAIVQRVLDLAKRLHQPRAALNMAKTRGTLVANEKRVPGDMRRKDQEITNEPSAARDMAWPGSTYSEGIGMKKLEKVLEGTMQGTVESEYFRAIVRSDDEDMVSTVALFFRGGPERVRGGFSDTKEAMKAALAAMDSAFEKAIA